MSNAMPLLSAQKIDKRFPGVHVLKQVDFDVLPGEVHGLMGENGAGKSTLIKIITGVYPMDSGSIFIEGKPVEIYSRQDAIRNGIAVIYQELSLIPTLTVAENIFLGQEPTFGHVLLNRGQMRKRVQELIDQYHFELKPCDVVETLSIAKRQTIEIMKALIMDAKLIIMDEPTASLNAAESEVLFDIIRNLKAEGKSIIYISHRLEEVYALVDRLTVLRDGQVVGVLQRGEIQPCNVVHLMLGKDLKTETHEQHEAKPDAAVLEVTDLRGERIHGVSFKAYGGQILGISGLVGAGRTEVLRSIFGLDDYTGTVTLNGKQLPRKTVDIMREGIGLVPEDRRREGFIPMLTIERNIALGSYDTVAGHGIVNTKKEKALGKNAIAELDIRPANAQIQGMNLSGGNQQKVVLGKWLQGGLRVLLVDEPTVGIDVGAKSEIYKIMRDLADEGCIVLVVTSDMEELLKISDRILILVHGKVFKEMRNEGLTQDDVLIAASGLEEEKA